MTLWRGNDQSAHLIRICKGYATKKKASPCITHVISVEMLTSCQAVETLGDAFSYLVSFLSVNNEKKEVTSEETRPQP